MGSATPPPTAFGLSEDIAKRVARERAAHADDTIDEQAKKWWNRFPHVFQNPAMSRYHERYEDELGDVSGARVLEYGCGHGDFSLWLIGRGARLCGIDISDHNITHCRTRLETSGLLANECRFDVMDAHALEFPDNYFDVVVGNGIIHHLDIPAAMREVNRVLRPGGKALFQEPMAGNPLLSVYRWVAGFHTQDEEPLERRHLEYLKRDWGVRCQYTGLVTLPAGVISSVLWRRKPENWLLKSASDVEGVVNSRGVLEYWNRFVMLVYQKPVHSH